MPFQVEVIRAAEFVRLGARGHFDFAASTAALATLARACRKRGIRHAVMDLRELRPGPKPVFTQADLIKLVRFLPQVGFPRRLRLAILYTSDPHRRARLFAFLSTLHGWSVRAFADFEEALGWLSGGDETDTPAAQNVAEQPVAIRFGKKNAGTTLEQAIAPQGKRSPSVGMRTAPKPAQIEKPAPVRIEVCRQ
jgi:hypothetical protein